MSNCSEGNSTHESTRAGEPQISLEIWKKVVDVQMHFNDLCLRLRSIAISILGVLLSASAIALKFGGKITICNASVHNQQYSSLYLHVSGLPSLLWIGTGITNF